MNYDWKTSLEKIIETKCIVFVRVSDDQQAILIGRGEVSLVRERKNIQLFKAPTFCIVQSETNNARIYVGYIKRLINVASLEARINIKLAKEVYFDQEKIVTKINKATKNFSVSRVITLSSDVSIQLVKILCEYSLNHPHLQNIEKNIRDKESVEIPLKFQKDGIEMSLEIAGIGSRCVDFVHIEPGQSTALSDESYQPEESIRLYEDNVIGHDGKTISGYELVGSDYTGYASFKNQNGQLEVFTGNRGILEKVFGVDLIYHNLTTGNMIMVQYKMLEMEGDNDWLYRPDLQFHKEVERMKKHSAKVQQPHSEFRLNPDIFYFKFVQRDFAFERKKFILPFGHLEQYMKTPRSNGLKGGKILSSKLLNGCHLDADTFISLIQAGYIGSYTAHTLNLRSFIQELLQNGNAVVVALHTEKVST